MKKTRFNWRYIVGKFKLTDEEIGIDKVIEGETIGDIPLDSNDEPIEKTYLIIDLIRTIFGRIRYIWNRLVALESQIEEGVGSFTTGNLLGDNGTISKTGVNGHGIDKPTVIIASMLVGGVRVPIELGYSVNPTTSNVTWTSLRTFTSGDEMQITIKK